MVPGRRCACTQNAVSMATTNMIFDWIEGPFLAAVSMSITNTHE